jgi:acetyltransferase-like isoleucine patch superfamily enzyme
MMIRYFKICINWIIDNYYIFLLNFFYPQKQELRELSPRIIHGYIIPQKIFNLNRCRHIPWPVHFTSNVSGKIDVGRISTPGMNPGCYIQGINGITIGDNVWIGPGVKIISANHDINDFRHHIKTQPIKIGNNVWIGANAIILPGIQIGNYCVIGAGSIVTKDIEGYSIVAGNPAMVIKKIDNSGDSSNAE